MTVRKRRLWAQVLLATAVAWAVLICPATAQSEDPLSAARTLYSERKYEEARIEAEKLLQGETGREAGLIVANCDRVLKRYDEAIQRYRELLDENPTDNTALSALVGLTDSLQRLGRFDESEKVLDRATRLYPEATDARLAAGGSSLYTRNRVQYESAVDFARGQLRQLVLRYESADATMGALVACRKLYNAYPEHPDAPQVALKLAGLLEGEAAAAYCLRALDSGYDRCFSKEAQLAVNQGYLDTVCGPPAEEQVAGALAGLFPQLTEAELGSLTAGWYEALIETYQPFSDHGRARWQALGKGKPWAAPCSLAIARSYIRDGLYQQAIDSLTDLPEEASIRQHRCMLLAQAHLGLRRFEDAAQQARLALQGPDRVLPGQAHLLTGRAAEMALDFDGAARTYRVAASECPSEWDRQQADYALKRVEELRALPVSEPRVKVLPDDRTTRGDWFLGYGREHYILCAQNFVLDRTGGLGPVLGYDYCTVSDHEPGRRWVTKKMDEDPVALWDPALQTHKPANWDDHGEQEPIGAGPDLLVSLEVPRGAHVLSLYFVNDYNYYEPNRYYTISITDDVGLQAVTDVEHFGGGVYKRFVVQGPTSLQLRIWRNLSINTLLSGVFLDPLPRMQPAPPLGVAYPHPQSEALAERCRTIDGRILNNPLSMPEQIASLDHLIADLRNESPEVSWMLSEALQARGHFRAAETAFDAYLAQIPEHCLYTQSSDAHARVADELIERDQHELLRRRLFPVGTHRWDRCCQAHFAALESRHSGSELVDALLDFARERGSHPTAFAAAMAFDRIAELSPQASDTPVVLLERARALDRAKRPREAVPVLQRLLEKDLSTRLRADATWLLLRMQVSAGTGAGEVRATYDSMLGLTPTEQQRRDGLYLVAAALIGAGDGATARDLLNQYESEYGATEATQALLRRSEP